MLINNISNNLIYLSIGISIYLTTYFDISYKRDGKPWKTLQYSFIWNYVRKYFKSTINIEESLDHNQLYIFGAFPHGACVTHHVLLLTDCNKMLSEIYKGERRDLAATILFYIPFLRELVLWLGNVDASSSTAHYNLKRGRSLLIYVGGEKEQLMTKPRENKIYLNNRKGFIKLALQYGAHLVPIYAFGENETYHTFDFLLGFRQWLQRNFQLGIPLAVGRFGSLLPINVQIGIEIGKPIVVSKYPVDEITESLIDQTHHLFVNEIIRLFDRTKHKYGYSDSDKLDVR